jgi:hypothetical protein
MQRTNAPLDRLGERGELIYGKLSIRTTAAAGTAGEV